MLVLSRKVLESVQITVPPSDKPQVISVFPTEIRGDKVRIGFEADAEVVIHRAEVQRAIDRQAGEAAA